MPRYNSDDLDSSELYDADGCMSDMERFERRNQLLEDEERFNAEGEDDDELGLLLALDSDFVFSDEDEYDGDDEEYDDEDE